MCSITSNIIYSIPNLTRSFPISASLYKCKKNYIWTIKIVKFHLAKKRTCLKV